MQSICDRVGIFVSGRMVASGRMEDLARDMATDEGLFEVRISKEETDPVALLERLPGVESVRRHETSPGLLLVSAGGDFPAQLSRALRERKAALLHLRRLDQELDELYQRYFRQETAGDGAR